MSVQVLLPGFDGRPIPTNSIERGEVHVKTKPKQRGLVSHVVLDFYGRSEVLITRRKEVSVFRYTHNHRFELDGPFTQQPRPTGSQIKWETFTYESRCLLFAHQQVLRQGNLQAPSSRRGDSLDTVIFPFEFRIPTKSEPQPPPVIAAHESNCFQASGYFTGSLGYYPPNKATPSQPLPDTMTHFEGMEDRNNCGAASISYTTRATAPQILTAGNKLFDSPDAAASAVDNALYNPAILRPHPVQHIHLSHEATIRTIRLHPNHQTNTELSFRDNMRSVFKKDSLPWLALGITFQAPDTVFLDHPHSTPPPRRDQHTTPRRRHRQHRRPTAAAATTTTGTSSSSAPFRHQSPPPQLLRPSLHPNPPKST